MRTLNKNEKRLLLLCVGTVFIVANMFLVRHLLGGIRERRAAIAQLEGEVKANEIWLGDKEYWEVRKAWLRENLPTMSSAGQAGGEMLQSIQDLAFEEGFEIDKQALLPATETADYRTVAISVSLRGDLQEITAWLTTLQSPEKFYQIRELDLEIDQKARAETPQARCNITLARWFKPAGQET